MSFLDALATPYFWAYALSAAVLLAAAGAALFWLQRRGQRRDDLWRLFSSWVLLVGTVVLGVLLGHEGFVFVVVLVSLFACHDFARATGLYEDWLFTGLVYLSILAVNGVALWATRGRADAYGYDAFMATPIYGVAALCVLPLVRNRSEGMLPRVALAVMAFVYFAYFLAHLSLLAGFFALPEVVGYVFFVTFGCGVTGLASDLADRALGRHPIAPGISPEKTWEGAVVALAVAFVWSFSLGWTFTDFGWRPMLLSAVLFGVVGPVGDLVMRYAHRGLRLEGPAAVSAVDPAAALDHVSRLIFVAPLFFRVVHVFVDPASAAL
jgi:phosphatidate cytidylyltransferase